MIAYIEGIVHGTEENSLIVMMGGVGLRVFTPADILEQAQNGDQIRLYTYLYVREDMLSLYGFESKEERDFFNLLLGVNGVGPRVAMSILSTLSVESITQAVNHDQSDTFARVPGIGKKTAQKIIIHLQGKIETTKESKDIIKNVDTELLEALTSLGYSVVEAQAAMQSLPKDSPDDLEEKLRAVLRYFSV